MEAQLLVHQCNSIPSLQTPAMWFKCHVEATLKSWDKIGTPKISNITMMADGACKAVRPKTMLKVKVLK